MPGLGQAWSQESQSSERAPQLHALLVPQHLEHFAPTNPPSLGPYSPRRVLCPGDLVIPAWLGDGNSTLWLKNFYNILLLRFPCSFGQGIKMLAINML